MQTAASYVPTDASTIAELRAAAPACRGCELWEPATQVVFGRGDERARVIFVGEQPGDVEDQHGLPFVGPAGHLLRRAVDEAGLPVANLYITNSVKHFRFERRGQRRIHQTPDQAHITACHPWLMGEFALLRPEMVILLGATAAKAVLGPSFRVTRSRGVLMPWPASAQRPQDYPADHAARALATIHPSAVLRADNREIAYGGLVADLKVAAAALS